MCQELSFIRKLIGAQRHFRLSVNSRWGAGGWSCGFGFGLGFRGCNGLFVLTLYHRDKDKIPWDLGRCCQSEEPLPQDVSQAVRFLVPLTLSGQAKNKFTACGDRRLPTGWMLANSIERDTSLMTGKSKGCTEVRHGQLSLNRRQSVLWILYIRC